MPPLTECPASTTDRGDRCRRAFSDLALDVFRTNGNLIEAGDALVQDLGLTSARWQVLGAIALSSVPLPVASIARNMGLARQSVQRVVDDMRADGLVRFEPNPHHRRASLVAMTAAGDAAYRGAISRKDLWADRLTEGLSPEAIEAASALLRTLQQRIAATHPKIGALFPVTQEES